MKYTCQPTENSLDELGIPENPYFDPSHDSVASFLRFLEGGAFNAFEAENAHNFIVRYVCIFDLFSFHGFITFWTP